jgi:acetyl-CoA carboxylase biotin carboxyl carrier protein
VDVKPEDIETLVAAFDNSSWDEVRVRLGKVEIHLSKYPGDRDRPNGTAVHVTNGAADAAPSPPALPVASNGAAAGPAGAAAAAIPAKPAGGGAATVDAGASAFPEGTAVVRAPNFGTFYRAPKPGAAAYVEVGQRVEPQTEICLIEVMKLFTPVRAGLAGTIRGVLVKDSAMVEYDQPLFLIEPG